MMDKDWQGPLLKKGCIEETGQVDNLKGNAGGYKEIEVRWPTQLHQFS